MNFAPPKWVTEAAEGALNTVAANHYSHPKGRIRLREALSKYYSPQFGKQLNPDTEILITSGANEGAFSTARATQYSFIPDWSAFTGQYSMWTAFLEPGDEVIMFEPFFDQYLASVTFNGGKPVYVPLHPPQTDGPSSSDEWTIDFDELRCDFCFIGLSE